MSDGRQIKVGGQPRWIAPFNTRKVDAIFEIIENVGPQYISVLKEADRFRREYAEERPRLRIDKKDAQDALNAARDRGDGDAAVVWENVLAEMGQAKFLERPQLPGTELTLAAVVPHAMRQIRPQLIALIGLIAIPHDELKEAARNQQVQQRVREYGETLYDDTTPGEATDILAAGVELFLQDIETNRSRLGGLWATAQTALFGASTQDEGESSPTSKDPEGESSSQPSITSQAATTGRRKSSSTTSRTVTSNA